MKLKKVLPFLIVLLCSATGWAAPLKFISQQEFEQLAIELAPKVNLFGAVWSANPSAQFFGGTSRDYLYWLKGELQEAKTKTESDGKIAELRSRVVINVKDFIVSDSDVDVLTDKDVGIDAQKFGVKKVDRISADRFNLNTEAGRTEVQQGFLPVEKIRLGASGFIKEGYFRDGVAEIYDGKLTMVMPAREVFETTRFAKLKLNHPILLVLRYVRSLAIDYYNNYGSGAPDLKILFDIDTESKEALEQVVKDLANHDDLILYHNDTFLGWMRMLVRKSYRSYINPTATFELYKRFGLVDVVTKHTEEPINQYVFAKHHDARSVQINIAKLGADPIGLFTPIETVLPGRKLYHGTKTDSAFRLIMKQGIIPSAVGTAGDGLYGVGQGNRKFAEDWAIDATRLIEFDVKDVAKLVDVREGPGKEAYDNFLKLYPQSNAEQSWSLFADFVGADILLYPYGVPAVVVKNGGVLEKPRGVYKQLLSYSLLVKRINEVRSLDDLVTVALSMHESEILASELDQMVKLIREKVQLQGFEQFLKMVKKSLSNDISQKQMSSFFSLYIGLKGMEQNQNSAGFDRAQSLARVAFEDLMAFVTEGATDKMGGVDETKLKRNFERVQEVILEFFDLEQTKRLQQAIDFSMHKTKTESALQLKNQAYTDARQDFAAKRKYFLIAGYTVFSAAMLAIPFDQTRILGAAVLLQTIRAAIADFKSFKYAFKKEAATRKLELGQLAQKILERKLNEGGSASCVRSMEMGL